MNSTHKNQYGCLFERWEQQGKERVLRSLRTQELIALKAIPVFEKYRIKKVVLFGSVLENRMYEGSDIDLLVDYVPPEQFWAFHNNLEEVLNMPVDIYTMNDNRQFTSKILRRGRVIYEV